MASTNAPPNVYQFKISLSRFKPPIWRRIQVPEDYTFHQLHIAFQKVMGWSGSHLHQFIIKNPLTSKETNIGHRDIFDTLYEKNIKISSYFLLDSNNKASYWYDLGSTWDHDVILEKILPAKANTEYPKCISGRRNPPPEDPTASEDDAYDSEENQEFDPRYLVILI